MSDGPALKLVRPVLRQIQLPVDEGAALVRDVSRKHADLAVRDLTRRSGVLPTTPTRVQALPEKARLVDHQHGSGQGERLKRIVAHHVPQGIGLLVAAAEHRLMWRQGPGSPAVSARIQSVLRCSGPSSPSRKAAVEAATLGSANSDWRGALT